MSPIFTFHYSHGEMQNVVVYGVTICVNTVFCNRVVNTWNSLPNYVVPANTTNVFKNRLDKFWHDQEIIYDFNAQLEGTGSRSAVE